MVEAAVRVIRREGPDASMDRFAAEAGVAKPILYRVFGDRAGLHRAVGEHAFASLGAGLDQVLAAAGVAPRQMVADAIDTYLAFVEREPELYRFLALHADPVSRRQAVDDYLARVSRQVAVVLGDRLRSAGRDSGAAEAWAYGMVGMAVAAGSWWLERGAMSRVQLGSYLTQLVCDGLPGIPRESSEPAERTDPG
jgi:AcrR family transcriptional regulator